MVFLRALALLAMPVLLSGCFAMQSDLDPVKSDMSVLERQFVDLQRDVTKARLHAEEGQSASSDAGARLSAIEKRLDGIEAQLRELRQPQAAVAPQPMAPEPVVVEPIGEAPPGAAHNR